MFLLQGVQMTLHGTTLLDMSALLSVDTKTISMVFTADGLGRLIGSFISIFCYNRLGYDEIQLSISLLLKAGLLCAAPWQSSFGVYILFIGFNAACTGYFESGIFFFRFLFV